MKNSTTRFSSKVDDYVKYRPSYPGEVIDLLRAKRSLDASSIVADIGSGTGMLTKLFLDNGNRVLAVEPNREMREAAESLYRGHARFSSVAATAEDTTLADRAVDLIVAGQAFHWFDKEKCKQEFLRILRPGGGIVLIWNQRRIDSTPFLKSYEAIMEEHATDYALVNNRNVDRGIIEEFFSPATVQFATFENVQKFECKGLIGRCLSSSYAPSKGSAGHDRMVEELKATDEENDLQTTWRSVRSRL